MFQTQWTTLARHPNTLFGTNEKFDYFDHTEGHFNFPGIRSDCFESILYYYQSDILRSPKGVNAEVFLDHLTFFGIKHSKITVGPYETEVHENYEWMVPSDPMSWQSSVYLLLYHKSSARTKIFTFFDICFILLSVISFITATMPQFRSGIRGEEHDFYERYGSLRLFVILDTFCVLWFLFSFFLYFYAAPKKKDFLQSFQAVIDLVVITSFAVLVPRLIPL
eukprot:sb/3469780/